MSSTRKGNSLDLIDLKDLLRYSYLDELLSVGLPAIDRKLTQVSSYKSTWVTKFYQSFYTSLKTIYRETALEAWNREFMFALSTIISKPLIFLEFFITGAYELSSRSRVEKFIRNREVILSEVEAGRIEPSDISFHRGKSYNKYELKPSVDEAVELETSYLDRLRIVFLDWFAVHMFHSNPSLLPRAQGVNLSRYYQRKSLRNFVNSRFFGLIFSRLYIGSWTLNDFVQNFELNAEEGSLASLYDDINIWSGSSYAVHDLVRLSTHLTKSEQNKKKPFKLISPLVTES